MIETLLVLCALLVDKQSHSGMVTPTFTEWTR
jgi:hypothetical protein